MSVCFSANEETAENVDEAEKTATEIVDNILDNVHESDSKNHVQKVPDDEENASKKAVEEEPKDVEGASKDEDAEKDASKDASKDVPKDAPKDEPNAKEVKVEDSDESAKDEDSAEGAKNEDSKEENAKLEESVEGAKAEDSSGAKPKGEKVDENANDESKKAPKKKPSSESPPPGNSIYHIKWINFGDRCCPIVTQNVNGPCPLIGVLNVLLLRGKVVLNENTEVVSVDQLMQHVGETLLNSLPDVKDSNLEQNVSDAMAVLPKLQTGLDVNVKFCGVSKFEFTSELVIFDLLSIPLYHGWLVDPQQTETAAAIADLGYNALVERIISEKHSEETEKATRSFVAQQFLEDTASQLTYHGLYELTTTLKDNELAVFFRNNHFSTIYKRNGELFLLVTDQGFLKEPKVVWETLSSIDGDGHFVDDRFVTVPPKESIPSLSKVKAEPSEAQIEQE